MNLEELTKPIKVEAESSKEHDWLLDVEMFCFFGIQQSYLHNILGRVLAKAQRSILWPPLAHTAQQGQRLYVKAQSAEE